MDVVPETLSRDGEDAINITWTDGRTTRWTAARLRELCPCATCREKKKSKSESVPGSLGGALPVLSLAEARPLTITGMRPVGSYAYNIAFSDGHSSGLFTLEMLIQDDQAGP